MISTYSVDTETLTAAVRKAGYDLATNEIVLQIVGMTCASCVARVEKALKKVPGVAFAAVNLATERATVRVLSTVPPSALKAAVERAGYVATDVDGAKPQQANALPEWWPVGVGALLTLPLGRADAAGAVRY